MQTRISTVLTFVVFGLGAQINGQPSAPATLPARYPGIKTQFNRRLSELSTNADRLGLYRETVAQGRHSGRPMLKRMFGEFAPETFHLDPATPGLSTNVRLLASDNRYVVRGNARTLRYAMSFAEDNRFEVIGLNQTRVNSVGKTDADIIVRHRPTGLRVRMEVKNLSIASQRANMENLQNQILKMAQDAAISGETQIWANRQDVLPEVRSFAERHNVRVVERLRTGNTGLRPEDSSFGAFADGLNGELQIQAKLMALAGSAQLGLGAYLAYEASYQLTLDIEQFDYSLGHWLRFGEHGSLLLTGGGLSVAGAGQLARQIPRLANSVRLVSLTKWGGRIGFAGTALAEGFMVSEYVTGNLTERQFLHGQASLGGGLAGGAIGGWAGFKAGALTGGFIGSFFGPEGTAIGAGIGGTVGALGGGFGGGYVGAHFATQGAQGLFELRDKAQHEKYVEYLIRLYQSPRAQAQ